MRAGASRAPTWAIRALMLWAASAALLAWPGPPQEAAAQSQLCGQPVALCVWISQGLLAVVWPQDGHGLGVPIEASHAVNVSFWPNHQVSCFQQGPILAGFTLWEAQDDMPLEPLFSFPGRVILQTIGGATFPTLEFDNVPADLADNPTSVFRFVVGGPGGTAESSNMWVHALSGAPRWPDERQPRGTGSFTSTDLYVGEHIQRVLLHNAAGQPVAPGGAANADFTVGLFVGDTFLSIPEEFVPDSVYLQEWDGNALDHTASGQPSLSTYSLSGQQYRQWLFRNVPVAPNPPETFGVLVHRQKSYYEYTNLWSYGDDIRTQMPDPPVPPSCVPPSPSSG